MSWIRSGSCNQCGACCFEVALFMMNKEAGSCKYLIQEPGKYICEITDGKFSDTEDLGFTEILPQRDIEYWKTECQSYPDASKEEHTTPIHELPDKCSYIITKEGV